MVGTTFQNVRRWCAAPTKQIDRYLVGEMVHVDCMRSLGPTCPIPFFVFSSFSCSNCPLPFIRGVWNGDCEVSCILRVHRCMDIDCVCRQVLELASPLGCSYLHVLARLSSSLLLFTSHITMLIFIIS